MYTSNKTARNTALSKLCAALLSCAAIAIACTPLFAQENKENPTVTGHATVHIVFIVPNETSASNVQGSRPQALVGDIILPIQSIRPVSITIDGDFVGHALTGFAGIKPIYVLPHGRHKFEFACEGFKTSKSELTVIGTGSTQYLIVKLEPSPEGSQVKVTSGLSDSNTPR